MSAPLIFTLVAKLQEDHTRAEHDGVRYHVDDRPPAGLMAALLGPRIPSEQVGDDEMFEEHGERVRALIRAYPVASLLGAQVTCMRDSELEARLAAVLDERCPGIEWRVNGERLAGPLRKYGIVHTSVEAPPDEATAQPMALELYGEVTELDGNPVTAGGAWIDSWRGRQGEIYPEVEVTEPFTFELVAATYANVLYPGANVPFYM